MDLPSRLEFVQRLLSSQELDVDAVRNVLGTQSSGPNISMLYGETPLRSVARMFEIIDELLANENNADEGEHLRTHVLMNDGSQTFLDIGSGRGHVVFAAAAVQNWRRCVGVELVESHVAEAHKSVDALAAVERQASEPPLPTSSDKISFICMDAVRDPSMAPLLAVADVVYCFDLAFDPGLRVELSKVLAANLKEGALLISTHIDRIPSVAFHLVGPLFSIHMDWGACPAKLYRKGSGAYEAWLETHEGQLQTAEVPQILWPTAFHKMVEQRFDIGDVVEFANVGNGDESDGMVLVAKLDLEPASGSLYLLDHCWTFASRNDAETSLAHVSGLRERLQRMCPQAISSVSASALLDACRPLLSTYALVEDGARPEIKTAIYFMLDEVGSCMRRKHVGAEADLHEGPANFKLAALYSFDHRLAFSLAWPLRPIAAGSVLFADHEQGWDLEDAHIDIKAESDSRAVALPEIKEFHARTALHKMIQSQP